MYVMKVIDPKGGGGVAVKNTPSTIIPKGEGGAYISITTEKMLALNNARFSITVA